ncbi:MULTISPECIES: hypothetical protein [Pseudomonas]|jgi:hypothetical protein|uniref:Lipoprotein n=1 Tax=Pseudomonas plecoglossicida TaxID=70775 RepID=A0ABX4TWI0_PSEDL|nr:MULTISPECIES: hypothetical protein [Pseudomonas]PLU87385.1 hypothetical protein CXG44_11120 [Pseudomonas plecoglossicida]PLU92888.1 hypothetical protein CXG45_12435 [Pseudomonas plecoglossicida]PLV02573.1 hypothetical protein CXG48_16615 [Pseudomonas plecoglossicida]PLV06620.1 hypothetical protein CXG47_27870 [Pseudomonas plecoglossicida]QNT39002.1 hypothetical protein ICJ54_15765 [Pseudomonas asiatica]
MYRKIVPLALLATLAGCSNSEETSEASFQKAAQAYLDTQYPHCFVISSFPTKTQDFDLHGTNKALHALAQVGVVSEKEISRTEVPARLWQAARTDIYYAYDLTDEGRKYYKADNGLCFGKAQVTAIEQFSEPSEVTGQKMSNVTYAYKITGLPAWAGDEGVKASIAELGKAVASNEAPLKETRAMVLTSQGWRLQEK